MWVLVHWYAEDNTFIWYPVWRPPFSRKQLLSNCFEQIVWPQASETVESCQLPDVNECSGEVWIVRAWAQQTSSKWRKLHNRVFVQYWATTSTHAVVCYQFLSTGNKSVEAEFYWNNIVKNINCMMLLTCFSLVSVVQTMLLTLASPSLLFVYCSRINQISSTCSQFGNYWTNVKSKWLLFAGQGILLKAEEQLYPFSGFTTSIIH